MNTPVSDIDAAIKLTNAHCHPTDVPIIQELLNFNATSQEESPYDICRWKDDLHTMLYETYRTHTRREFFEILVRIFSAMNKPMLARKLRSISDNQTRSNFDKNRGFGFGASYFSSQNPSSKTALFGNGAVPQAAKFTDCEEGNDLNVPPLEGETSGFHLEANS